MRVGCLCPPVRNNIVTLCHFFNLWFQFAICGRNFRLCGHDIRNMQYWICASRKIVFAQHANSNLCNTQVWMRNTQILTSASHKIGLVQSAGLHLRNIQIRTCGSLMFSLVQHAFAIAQHANSHLRNTHI